MFSVTVREHMMIAHSFKGELFGPAQQLHGATYVVDVEFRRATLDSNNVVIDIGRASEALREIMGEFNYKNLDELPALGGENTTTEFMCKTVFSRMLARIKTGKLGPGSEALETLKVTLQESHVAWASYEGQVR
jgi:6-pyruvoyltetrahydropterin/6-carboxytetrahydropterin synthase